jgi:hypothetical protein
MALLSLSALLFEARPGPCGEGSTATIGIWAPLVVPLLDAVLILTAALASPTRLHPVVHSACEMVRVAAALMAMPRRTVRAVRSLFFGGPWDQCPILAGVRAVRRAAGIAEDRGAVRVASRSGRFVLGKR